MKKQLKKLNLKKSTVVLLGAEKEQMLKGGREAATQPAVSCFVACGPSLRNPCLPQTERCPV